MILTFETHATSVHNKLELASGHFDSPLSDVGEKQAAELGARYSSEAVDYVFCSDL
ncbi:MAG: histidine phosphatase family protein, partial [bacterium]|nr:histidine phosphatase family protein [bacterium]